MDRLDTFWSPFLASPCYLECSTQRPPTGVPERISGKRRLTPTDRDAVDLGQEFDVKIDAELPSGGLA
jgi:hypothetical protein